MADVGLGGPLRHTALAIDGVEVSVSSARGDDALEAVRQGRADAAIVWSGSYSQRDLDGVVLGSVVFLNLIVNAADAIEETGRRGVITVATDLDGKRSSSVSVTPAPESQMTCARRSSIRSSRPRASVMAADRGSRWPAELSRKATAGR